MPKLYLRLNFDMPLSQEMYSSSNNVYRIPPANFHHFLLYVYEPNPHLTETSIQ